MYWDCMPCNAFGGKCINVLLVLILYRVMQSVSCISVLGFDAPGNMSNLVINLYLFVGTLMTTNEDIMYFSTGV